VNATNIFRAIAEQGVTHFCAAPIVMAGIANSPVAERQALPRQVRVLTAGSPPPAAVLEAVGAMGFEVDHVFGITEISGTHRGRLSEVGEQKTWRKFGLHSGTTCCVWRLGLLDCLQ